MPSLRRALCAAVAAAVAVAAPPAVTLSIANAAEDEIFIQKRDGCGPLDYPDWSARAFRAADGTVTLMDSNSQGYHRATRARGAARFTRDCRVALASGHAGADAQPSDYNNSVWLQSFWVEEATLPSASEGRVVALVHNEFHGERATGTPALCPSRELADCWYANVLAAASDDGGQTFQLPPLPARAAIVSPTRYAPDGGRQGYVQMTNIVRNASDGAWYTLVMRSAVRAGGATGPILPPGLCVWRSENVSDAGAWRGWDGARFTIPSADPYGAGGSAVACTATGPTELRFTLVWSVVGACWLGIGIGAGQGGEPSIVYATSPDLFSWSDLAVLRAFGGGPGYPQQKYPSLLDLDAADVDVNFINVGAAPSLTYTRLNADNDRDLVRQTVAVALREGAPPEAAARAAVPPSPPSLPWPFAWDTLSTFAFPGAAPRFMTPAEVAYFAANFSSILIWGLNATCADGSAPDCSHSTLYCNRSAPEAQAFMLTMESSLQEQGARLKAARPGAYYPVFGYIESLSAQKYYAAQARFLDDPAFLSWRLSVASKGVIDCYRDGCNWQGTEFRQYDLTQQAVRDYYVSDVIGALVNGSGLDGTFLDVIDWWSTACDDWPCTPAEAAALTTGALQTLDALLAAYPDKVFSVSSHTSLAENAEFYFAQLELLKSRGNGVRFWEFFSGSAADVASLVYETQTVGVPTHVHATKRTLAPDWLELAAFLIGAGEHSYFSYSGPWMLDSFDVFPEYARPLGAPLGPPSRVPSNWTAPAWLPRAGLNLVDDLPSAPNSTGDIPGVLAFLGLQPTFAACAAAAHANASFTAISWVAADGDAPWATTCWGRLDAVDWAACITAPRLGPPCYAAAEVAHTSAVGVGVPLGDVWTRSFAHLDVTLGSDENGAPSATLAWK